MENGSAAMSKETESVGLTMPLRMASTRSLRRVGELLGKVRAS
jgi:hypothetical protein